jgi:hypothetical protein
VKRLVGLTAGLDLEVDLDLVADDRAGAAAVDAEVLAADLGGGGDADDRGAVHAVAEAVDLQVERDRIGDAADGQLTVEQEVVAVLADAGRDELVLGVLADVQDVLALDVRVAMLLAAVEGVGVNGRRDLGVEGVLGGDDLAGEGVELAADL